MATSPDRIQATPVDAPETESRSLSVDGSSKAVRIHRDFAKLNEALVRVADGLGVKRSASVPYIDGQPTAEHIKAVGAALALTGGLTQNLALSHHNENGGGWGTGDGQTVAYNADKLRQTLIPKNSEDAKAAIRAATSVVKNVASLIGDTPEIKTAKSQLALVGSHDGESMTCSDFLVALQQIVHQPLQALARAHSGTKEGGHGPQLRAPKKNSKS